jgi:type III secretion protein J
MHNRLASIISVRLCTHTQCVIVGLCAMLLLTGCKEDLFSKVDERDANAALGALYAEGVSANKTLVEGDIWRVEVDSKDLQKALLITRHQGIPRERFSTMGDLFKKEGLVSTPSEVRMRHLFAVSQELSSTLSHIDGIISARVHPVMPVNDPLSDKSLPSSAAVFIKHSPDTDVQQMAPAIKALVAKSIEGLSVDQVSLTFFAIKALPPSTGNQSSSIDTYTPLIFILLAACLALALGLLGWQQWRKKSALTLTTVAPLSNLTPLRNKLR